MSKKNFESVKFDNLEILILSEDAAVDFVRKSPYYWNVISIRDHNDAPVDEVASRCQTLHKVKFDDIDAPVKGFTIPTEEHVRSILDFSRDKKEILIHCTAGISRSSASAYLIACTRMPPIEAIKCLNTVYHWPNALVVKIGAKILNNPQILHECEKWKTEVMRLDKLSNFNL